MEMKESECSCEKCVKMCSRPCWGTPQEIKKIIEQGFEDKLMIDWWSIPVYPYQLFLLCGALVGCEKNFAPKWDPTGKCSLLTPDNKCEIHLLKPVEGRISSCTNRISNSEIQKFRYNLSLEWQKEEGKEILTNWKQKVGL